MTACFTTMALAEGAVVAVASNFRIPAESLVQVFEEQTGHSVVVTSGSTGTLYAQIVNGAPFDVLLAADAERPGRLVKSGAALPDSRFTYAVGQLVLWSADPALNGHDCAEMLQQRQFRRLAIANPDTAPYGAAARQVLERLSLWGELDDRLVVGENIAQGDAVCRVGQCQPRPRRALPDRQLQFASVDLSVGNSPRLARASRATGGAASTGGR